MHFFWGSDWWLFVLITIGLFTIIKGGGWKEFVNNDLRFNNWLTNYGLYMFLIVLCIALVLFGAAVFFK